MGCISADDANTVQYNTNPNQVPQILKTLGIGSFSMLQTNFCDGNLCNHALNLTKNNKGHLLVFTLGFIFSILS